MSCYRRREHQRANHVTFFQDHEYLINKNVSLAQRWAEIKAEKTQIRGQVKEHQITKVIDRRKVIEAQRRQKDIKSLSRWAEFKVSRNKVLQ